VVIGFVGKAGVNGGVCAKPSGIQPFGTSTRTVGNGTPESCTEAALRGAMASGGKIAFSCGDAVKTITLTSVIPYLVSADLEGAGKLVLSGGGSTRLFRGSSGQVLTLRNLTIRDGYFNSANPGSEQQGAAGIHTNFRGGIVADNVKFLNNVSIDAGKLSERNGGAVSTHESPVAIFYNSLFQDNSGHLGSAINNLLTNLDVVNTTVLNNTLTDEGFGGAIYSDGALRTYDDPTRPNVSRFTSSGYVSVCGSLIEGNRGGYTGAVYTCGYANDQATVDRSMIIGNSTGNTVNAATGGGLTAQCNARMLVKNSTIANNIAKGYGGGIWHGSSDNNPLNRLVILNSTVTGNKTTMGPDGNGGVGGGISIDGNASSALLNNVTIAYNSSGQGGGVFMKGDHQVVATNTIVAHNNSTNPWNMAKNCSESFRTGAGIFEFPAKVNGNACASNPVTVEPGLADALLSDNGGPTKTMRPSPNSVARGAGSACEAIDQRGVNRGARCDAGAVVISAP